MVHTISVLIFQKKNCSFGDITKFVKILQFSIYLHGPHHFDLNFSPKKFTKFVQILSLLFGRIDNFTTIANLEVKNMSRMNYGINE